MERLDYIKSELIKRIKSTDDKIINPIDIQLSNNEKQILDVIFHREGKDIQTLLNNNTVNDEFLESLFGIDVLNRYNVYTSGENVVYGGYRFTVIGKARIFASSNAEVYAFQNSYVSTRQKATLYAFDNTTFDAYNSSKLMISYGNVSGNLHDIAIGRVYNNTGKINVFDESDITICDSINVVLHDRTHGHIHGISNIVAYEDSHVELFDKSTGFFYNNTWVCARNFSNAYVCSVGHCDLYDNSHGYIESVDIVHAYDKSNVELTGQKICNAELFNDSIGRIYNTCIHIRLHNNSYLQDYTDTYLNPFDNSVIMWMNCKKVWFTQIEEEENKWIDYGDEDVKCPIN